MQPVMAARYGVNVCGVYRGEEDTCPSTQRNGDMMYLSKYV